MQSTWTIYNSRKEDPFFLPSEIRKQRHKEEETRLKNRRNRAKRKPKKFGRLK